MQQVKLRIALLIDADNAPAAKIEDILSEVAKHGVANVRRAYGNWKNPNLKGWEACLHQHAIRPMQQFDYIKGKNATDAALIIDAMDLLYQQKLDAFAIVSSDCDFTPLIMRVLTNGLKVYGFGEKKTPLPFVQACSTFLYLESLGQAVECETVSVGSGSSAGVAPGTRKTGEQLKQDTKLMNLLRGTVTAIQDEKGWSRLSTVGAHISNQASFDSRNYGYANLSGLFEAIDLFELHRKDKAIYVRSKQKGKNGKKTA